MGMSVRGIRELENKLNRIVATLPAVNMQSLLENAQDLKGRSQALAPVDSGDLRGSCDVDPIGEGTTQGVRLGYGLIYSHYQHEGVNFNHPKGGQAKYLEEPFKEQVGYYIKNIKDNFMNQL